MVDLTDRTDEKRGIFEELVTREQALAYMAELVDGVEKARAQTIKAGTVLAQEKAKTNLFIRYGRAVGALATLMHCRRITDIDYNQLATRAHTAMLPRVVEVIGS